MLINLSELFTCEGKKERFIRYHLNLDPLNSAVTSIRLSKQSRLSWSDNIGGGKKYTMSGGLSVTVEAPRQVPGTGNFVCELVFDRELDLGKKEEQEDSLDEEPYLSGYSLDVDQLVCNELLLSLPMRVLCSEDCKGFAIDVEQISILGLVPVTLGRSDPRMSVIQEILINLRRCNHVYMSKEQIFQSKKRQPQG